MKIYSGHIESKFIIPFAWVLVYTQLMLLRIQVPDREVYDVPLPRWKNIYAGFHFFILISIFHVLSSNELVTFKQTKVPYYLLHFDERQRVLLESF